MSVNENTAIVRHLVEDGWNSKHLETFDALLAPHFTNHDPGNPAAIDLNGLKQFVQAVWRAFPDFFVQITEEIGEEDNVVKCWAARGTQGRTQRKRPGGEERSR